MRKTSSALITDEVGNFRDAEKLSQAHTHSKEIAWAGFELCLLSSPVQFSQISHTHVETEGVFVIPRGLAARRGWVGGS